MKSMQKYIKGWSFVGLWSASFIVCLSFSSCKKSSPTQTTKVNNEVQIPDGFLEFYDEFHQDSIFQKEHIVFPIRGASDSVSISKSDWIVHKAFDSMEGTFRRDINVFSDAVVIEVIQDNSGSFRMERRFGNTSDGWKLIYYDPMRQVGEFLK